MGDWDTMLETWVLQSCYAAALGKRDTGEHFAAAPRENGKGWSWVYAEAATRDIMQEDLVTTKPVHIVESETIVNAINDAASTKPVSSPHGLWIGGVKYNVCQRETDVVEAGGKSGSIVWVHARNLKKGVHLVATEKTVVIGLYDEELKQSPILSRGAVTDFAKSLIGDFDL